MPRSREKEEVQLYLYAAVIVIPVSIYSCECEESGEWHETSELMGKLEAVRPRAVRGRERVSEMVPEHNRLKPNATRFERGRCALSAILKLELIQPHMTQKPMLWGDVDACALRV